MMTLVFAATRLARLAAFALLCASTACGSSGGTRSASSGAEQSPGAGLAGEALAEDHRKGRCDHPQDDFDGLFTSVRTCARGDLDAGTCDWRGTTSGLDECELKAGDEENLGAFVRKLREASGGRVRAIDDVQGPTVKLSVYFSELNDWRLWQQRHQEETLDRALLIWGPVYRRNHRIPANACVSLVDKAFVGGDLQAWEARVDGPDVIVAERCEGD